MMLALAILGFLDFSIFCFDFFWMGPSPIDRKKYFLSFGEGLMSKYFFFGELEPKYEKIEKSFRWDFLDFLDFLDFQDWLI